MSEFNKAIVATVGAVVAILASFGIAVDPTIAAAVVTLLTALAVYWVPNTDPGFDDQGRDDRLDPDVE